MCNPVIKIPAPVGAQRLIAALQKAGYEAYIVGGCVRDTLLGIQPKDWDICTSALPGQVADAVACVTERVIPTGVQHGTVTAVVDGIPYEITTFREDGRYSDFRRPDSVQFVNDLDADLSRRDFTINAMAYSDATGVVDPFGGQQDMCLKLVRCVGNPSIRFYEDPLRILRALRFAATLGFAIEAQTQAAMRDMCQLLEHISAERICAELRRILAAQYAMDVLLVYRDVLAVVVPELPDGYGYHRGVQAACAYTYSLPGDQNPLLCERIALLFACSDSKKHPRSYSATVRAWMTRLRFEKKTIEQTVYILQNFRFCLTDNFRLSIVLALHQHGSSLLRRMVQTDIIYSFVCFGQEIFYSRDIDQKILHLSEHDVYKIQHLAVNGDDITSLGLQGKEVGQMLDSLLVSVMIRDVSNTKEDLIEEAKRLKKEWENEDAEE